MKYAYSLIELLPKSSKFIPPYSIINKPKNYNTYIKELWRNLKDRNLSTEENITDTYKYCKNTNPLVNTKKVYSKVIKRHIDT